jgi:V8-like Glu-specific endopeptidase
MPLQDVLSAPAEIQTASKAIVRIRDQEASGTGFFISKEGRLVTNYHVVGPDTCLKEGCYLRLDFNFQRGGEWKESVNVYALPLMTNAKLDLSLLQIYQVDEKGKTDKKLSTPEFLKFSSTVEEPLKKLYVVGHPQGGLKKWSVGDCFKKVGDWRHSTHCCLGGNSGSPVLNDKGEIEGLVHRASEVGPETLSLESNRNSGVYSSAKSIQQFINQSKKRNASLKEFATLKEVVQLGVGEIKFLLSLHKPFSEVQDTLYKTCKTILDSDTLDLEEISEEGTHAALTSCESISDWVNCNTPDKETYYKSCPSEEIQKKWLALFERIAKIAKSSNHLKYSSIWEVESPAIFYNSTELARDFKLKKTRELFKDEKEDIFLMLKYFASYASNEKELSFNGFQFLKIFQEYDKNPYYDQDYENIVTAFFGLYENKNIDKEEATKILTKFFNDKKLPVSIKIETESQAFKLGLIR